MEEYKGRIRWDIQNKQRNKSKIIIKSHWNSKMKTFLVFIFQFVKLFIFYHWFDAGGISFIILSMLSSLINFSIMIKRINICIKVFFISLIIFLLILRIIYFLLTVNIFLFLRLLIYFVEILCLFILINRNPISTTWCAPTVLFQEALYITIRFIDHFTSIFILFESMKIIS